jgi:hypothetical protein
MHIGKVNLDERKPDRSESVPQCDAGMGKRRRIDNDEPRPVGARQLNSVNEFTLAVGLERLKPSADSITLLERPVIDFLEGARTVDARFPRTEQV